MDEHILGVKIQGNIAAMEQCEQSDFFAVDLSKYDMILRDELTESRNNNKSYRCNINMVDRSKVFFEINGWKLKDIFFRGCWTGQTGFCNVEDRYGKKYEIDGCSEQWYSDHYISMLTQCLYNFISFAKVNFSVDYIELSKKMSEIDELGDYLSKYKVFEKNIYNDQTLTRDEKLELLSKIRSDVIDNVITCMDKK
jgi:hypothetical protein